MVTTDPGAVVVEPGSVVEPGPVVEPGSVVEVIGVENWIVCRSRPYVTYY
jgi:hypothetical protein